MYTTAMIAEAVNAAQSADANKKPAHGAETFEQFMINIFIQRIQRIQRIQHAAVYILQY